MIYKDKLIRQNNYNKQNAYGFSTFRIKHHQLAFLKKKFVILKIFSVNYVEFK